MITGLFLQISIILFPILLYFSLLKDSQSNFNDWLWKISLIVATSLSMVFSIELIEGVRADLRFVPWFIAFLYGGRNFGLLVTFIMIGLRIPYGGIGMYSFFGVITIMLVFVYFYSKKYTRLSYRNKVKFGISFMFAASFLSVVLVTFESTITTQINFTMYAATFIIDHVLATLLFIYVIETAKEKNMYFSSIQRSDQLNIVGEMAASVAHEIRNPLTIVKGFIQLLHKEPNLYENQKHYLNISLQEIDRAEVIIGDYLSIAKADTSQEEIWINLNDEIQSVKNTLSSFAAYHNSQICTYSDEKHLYIKGYRGKVQQILINLIKNGIEATEENGIITIHSYRKKDHIFVEIKDNGIGISQDKLKNIGLPFYSTKEKGTGLGVMLCFRLMETMDGTILVSSKPNKGTCFTLKFPNLKRKNII